MANAEFYSPPEEPKSDSLSFSKLKIVKIQSEDVDVIFIMQKIKFTLIPQKAIENNRQGNEEFY